MKPPPGYRIDSFHPLSKGLVACYLMNEKGDIQIHDLTGNGNTGTFVNDTHWVVGPNGPAIDFDGTNDYINLGNFLGAFDSHEKISSIKLDIALRLASSNNSTRRKAHIVCYLRTINHCP